MNEEPKADCSNNAATAKQTQKTKKKSRFFLGAVLGSIAGTIAGILIAPKPGEETRAEIAASGRQAKRDLRDKIRRYKESKKPYVQKRITAGKVLDSESAQTAPSTNCDSTEDTPEE